MSPAVFSSWGGKVLDARPGGAKPITASDVGLSLAYDSHEVKAFISWDGVILDETVSVVALASAYMQEVAALACGECGVGYNGTRLIADTLGRIAAGEGSAEDIALLKSLASGIRENARCDFCAQAVTPILDSLEHFEDDFGQVIKKREALPQLDYITKVTAPCLEACPIHQDVPGYIELVRNRRYTEALEVIRRTNCLPGVLGRTCVAFCERNCVRQDIDSPLAIKALKRVPADVGIIKPLQSDKPAKREKVAVVGAGPAGLAAAQHLALLGYRVSVLDAEPYAGGMSFVGIPAYRLPRKAIAGEAETIESLGVEFRLGTRIQHIEDLAYNFKAVLLASGAHLSKDAGIDNWNKDYDGLMDGVRFLHEVNSGNKIAPREKVLIVGGGNTAIDCARTALRLGFKEVTVVYRRSRVEMPARADEVRAAEEEGVRFYFLALPIRIIAENGKVTGAECQRMELGEPDASGRRRPLPVKGSEFTLPAGMVLTAIGEAPELSFLPKGRVELTDWGSVKTDEEGRTNIPWLFAAGDCASGPATIVEAMAAAGRAASSLDRYLSKNRAPRPEEEAVNKLLHDVALSRKRNGPRPAQELRQHPRELVLDRLKDFDEVEQCFEMPVASREAGRCLRCYRVMLIVRK